MNLELLVQVAHEWKMMRREIKEEERKERLRNMRIKEVARQAIVMMVENL